MRFTLLFILSLLFLLPKSSFAQRGLLIQKVKLGKVKAQGITYYEDEGGFRISNASYDEILASPKLTVEGTSCKIASYKITILRDESDIYGPYKITGEELTDEVRRIILRLKYTKNTTARINIESIEMNCPDKDKSVRGELMYTFK